MDIRRLALLGISHEDLKPNYFLGEMFDSLAENREGNQ